MRSQVIIIDDQTSILESMEIFFRLRNWEVYTAATGTEGLELIEKIRPSLVVLDIRLPGMSGLEVLEQVRERFSDIQVIMITAFQSMESTIQAIKLGAFDYLHKPIDITEMDAVIQRLEQTSGLEHARVLDPWDQDICWDEEQPQIVAKSRSMKDVSKTIALISESRVTVLVQGESGTGKELIARSVHHNSPWKDKPFTVMDCSTLVDTLMESELFGYEKGAFTGAYATRKGRLELTGEGTIFFDEIGELPLIMQSKILRFLQSREFTRVGGHLTLHSNARIIAATNRDLTALVQTKAFREDLYYRLKVVTINVPPLRERKSDIPFLVSFFLKKIAHHTNARLKSVAPEALDLLIRYDWPGNVRQLENALTRAVVLTPSLVLSKEHTYACLQDLPQSASKDNKATRSLKSVEREHVLMVLEANQWHLGKACEQLGVSRPTLREKIKKFGLSNKSRERVPKSTS
jgi:two-component system, NtrC family, response regulator AtoC